MAISMCSGPVIQRFSVSQGVAPNVRRNTNQRVQTGGGQRHSRIQVSRPLGDDFQRLAALRLIAQGSSSSCSGG